MPETSIFATACTHHGQMAEALEHLENVLVEGLRHGFFECSITCEIVSGGKRQIVICAGKSHKFTIPDEDLPR